MTIQKDHNFLSIIIVFLVLFSITPVIYCDSDEYDVDIDENSNIIWKVIEADEDQLDYLLSVVELDEDDFDYEEGDKIKYEINSINEISSEDYYLISYDQYKNDENQGTVVEKIAMDPEDLAEDLEDFELDDYSITFILTDTEDYIDEVADKISDSYKTFIYNSGSSIILNSSIGNLFWLKMDYDEHGILEEMSLVYEGEEIFNMEQRSYTKSNVFPLFWVLIIALIIIVGVIIIVIALIVVLIKKGKKKRAPVAPILIKPTPDIQTVQIPKNQIVSETQVEKDSEKISFCPNCGAKRDSDALFCTYCGSKF